MSNSAISRIPTIAFQDQKPGTSGLRKRVIRFQELNYTQNFVQSILSSIPTGPQGSTLVVGGDGRFYSHEAIKIIIQLAGGNKVTKLVIGRDGILSTPAASHLIRKLHATGGILLTASHNQGGPNHDFGIKYNMENGGPAPEAVTDSIFEYSKNLKEYLQIEVKNIDLKTLGTCVYGNLVVEIIDPICDYVSLMKEVYDFTAIKQFIKNNQNFTFLFDAMHAVTGPYAIRIFVDEFGLPPSSVINCIPSLSFNGGHPDPNLTYAHELVELVESQNISFGAASDGDGDRNMIIGKSTFINPSDSVAIIAANAHCIPYFQKTGIKGLARSMPTSAAIDRVAEKLGYPIFQVPTGWKFFGNLMDAGSLSICGEESFGTGSDHIREKDGIWAILAWLSILAHESLTKYDYENVDSDGANEMMTNLRALIGDSEFIGSIHDGYKVEVCDDFSYTDPIDKSVSIKQGLRIIFTDSSRIVFRLSGTGSQGATVRLYVEKYDPIDVNLETQVAIASLIKIALRISGLKNLTGRDQPTVIT